MDVYREQLRFGDTRTWIQGTTGKIEIRLGDEPSCRIWTDQLAGQMLDSIAYEESEVWTAHLIDDLCCARPCAITQDDVWLALRVTLNAFDSAQANGQPVALA